MVYDFRDAVSSLPLFDAKKKCPTCGSETLVRNGRRYGRQRYLCALCGRRIDRRYTHHQPPPWARVAYRAYTVGKHTYAELAQRFGRDPRTLRRAFDRYGFVTGELRIPPGPLALSIDATFFGETYGVLVCRANGQNVYWKEIIRETAEDYAAIVTLLLDAGADVVSVTVDGMKGVPQLLARRFPGLPVQLCHFHQQKTVRSLLPPTAARSYAARALRALAGSLRTAGEAAFAAELTAWEQRYGASLKRDGRLRTAFRSLRRKRPLLFTFRRHPELHIPPTTNSCEGSFGHWKPKVRLHRGIARWRRKKLIDFMLS